MNVLVVTFLALGTLGCRTQQNRLHRFDQIYTRGDWDAARSYVDDKVKDDKNVLWSLQGGVVDRLLQDYAASNGRFDRAEALMQQHETDLKGFDALGTTLVSEGVTPYRGETYDGVMVNTYKALNYMSLGQDDLARVELNRAVDRQRRARERFSREIDAFKEEIAKDKHGGKVDYQRTVNDPNTESAIRRKYPSLYEFEAYPDFTNPFATYLAGVFFSMTGDPAKAVDLLKESAGMVPDSQTIESDFAIVDGWLSGTGAPEPCVWVIFENGLGPVKQEFRIDLPLFFFTDEVFYTGIALPRLTPRAQAASSLDVWAGEGWASTETVADMDRVIQTEFAKDFPGILTRALVGATAKALVQYALLKQDDNSASQLLGFVAAAYNAATTVADLRIWTSLPKDFQVVRVPMPENGEVRLRWNQTVEKTVSIGAYRYALIYVKMVAPGQEPVIQVVGRNGSR
jgi:hypothetical protein